MICRAIVGNIIGNKEIGLKSTLVVIGNGFDRYHELETSFGHFGSYFEEHNPAGFAQFQEVIKLSMPNLDLSNSWNEFETLLGEIDWDSFDEAQRSYVEAQNGFSEHNIELGVDGILANNHLEEMLGVGASFSDWVHSIILPDRSKRKFQFTRNTAFVNFNYTETLEHFYGVDQRDIFYLHGRRGTNDRLIVGHGGLPLGPKTKHELPEFDNDPFIEFRQKMRKPCDEITPRLDGFLSFTFPSCVDDIFVFGHSVNPIDRPYFNHIASKYPRARWRFSYRDDAANMRAKINELGLKESQIEALKPINDFEQSLFISGVD